MCINVYHIPHLCGNNPHQVVMLSKVGIGKVLIPSCLTNGHLFGMAIVFYLA